MSPIGVGDGVADGSGVGTTVGTGVWFGTAVGLGVGAAVAVLVGAGVAVGRGVAVPVGRGVALAVGRGVAVPVGRGVEVAVGRGVAVPVGRGVEVAVGRGVAVPVGRGVAVAVAVGVPVGRGVGVPVGRGVGVEVGRGVAVGVGVARPTTVTLPATPVPATFAPSGEEKTMPLGEMDCAPDAAPGAMFNRTVTNGPLPNVLLFKPKIITRRVEPTTLAVEDFPAPTVADPSVITFAYVSDDGRTRSNWSELTSSLGPALPPCVNWTERSATPPATPDAVPTVIVGRD